MRQVASSKLENLLIDSEPRGLKLFRAIFSSTCNFYIIRYTNFKKNLKRKNKVNKQVNKNRKSFASVKERERKKIDVDAA